MTTDAIILVHGGAGSTSNEDRARIRLIGVKAAAIAGYKALSSTGSILNAVEAAVISMEDNGHFNAGLGSILNEDGDVEMDASVMVGADLSAGAVTVVKDIKNVISLARMVMEKTEHILLAADGAKRFAVAQGVELLPPGALVTPTQKTALEKLKKSIAAGKPVDPVKSGTVGAVGIDRFGKMAAATSTGGREGKMAGRCSDSCIIGSGTYADDALGAVSTTGHGETIAKVCLAHSIVKDIEQGKSAQEATEGCLQRMTDRLKQTAGAITISKDGEVGIGFTSAQMAWAYVKGTEVHFGIDKGQHDIEPLEE